jgi:hypothetical protein
MNEKIKVLQIIHLGICAGTIVAYLFVGDFSVEILNVPSIDSSDLIYFAIPILALFLSSFLFKSQLKQVNAKLKLEDNLPIYQTASIIRWSVLEAAALLILFLKTELLVLGILMIIYLVSLRPTEDKIVSEFSKTV